MDKTTLNVITLLALLSLPATAIAEEKPAPPCSRSASHAAAGGVDIDVARCTIALDAQRMGEMQSNLNAVSAALALAKADLLAAQAAETMHAKEIADAEAQKANLIEWLKAAQVPAQASGAVGARK